MTKVEFRNAKNESTGEMEVLAYFPEEVIGWGIRMSYMHIGQHGECTVDFAKECPLATYKEYKTLYDELVSVGYDDLVVLNNDFHL